MIFTDDDLKRLKEQIDPETNLPLQALLARLEAAERALDCYYDEYGSSIEVSHEYRKWRKASGK